MSAHDELERHVGLRDRFNEALGDAVAEAIPREMSPETLALALALIRTYSEHPYIVRRIVDAVIGTGGSTT